MQVLHAKYPGTLQILAFPCNAFGGQEPGTPDEITQFARVKMGYQGPLFGKLKCDNGDETHPLFAALMTSLDNGIYGPGLKWNFAKFLCDADGVPVERFSAKTAPLSFEDKIVEVMSRVPDAK